MVSRFLVMLISAVIAGSFFFNWFALAEIEGFIPFDMASAMIEESGQSIPFIPALFIATFIFAALNTILGLIGYCSRYVTLAVGMLPFVAYIVAANSLGAVGLPFGPITVELSPAGFGDLLARALATFETGAWMYFGGAASLIVLAILDPGIQEEGRAVPVHYFKANSY